MYSRVWVLQLWLSGADDDDGVELEVRGEERNQTHVGNVHASGAGDCSLKPSSISQGFEIINALL